MSQKLTWKYYEVVTFKKSPLQLFRHTWQESLLYVNDLRAGCGDATQQVWKRLFNTEGGFQKPGTKPKTSGNRNTKLTKKFIE